MANTQKEPADHPKPWESRLDREAIYRAVIETSSDGFCIMDRDGRILEVNDTYVRRSGYTREELLTMHIQDLEAKENPPETAAHMDRIRREGSDLFETLHRAKDGTIWQVEVSASYWSIDGGRFFNFFRDITERKQSESALMEREQQLQTLNANLADGMVYQISSGLDGQLRSFTYLSPAVEKFHGLKVEDVMRNAMLLYDQVIEEDRALLSEQEAHAYATRTRLDSDVRVRLPSGELRWRRFTSSPRVSADGSLLWDGIEVDITERKQSEQALRESDLRFRYVFEQAKDGILIADVEQKRIIEANRAICALLGYTRDEIVELSVADLHPEKDLPRVLDIFERQVRGEISLAPDVPVLRKDGSVLYVEINSIGMSLGGRQCLIGIFRDITGRKLREERLKKINAVILSLDEHDHPGNLNRLTALCGELLRSDCALYNRLDGDLLCVRGRWAGPADLKQEDAPGGHICFDVISRDSDSPLVVRNLQETAYARTDPNVAAYGLRTYVGCRVRYGGNTRGSLCAVFTRDFEPNSDDLDVIGIVAAAIAQEEERYAAEEKIRRSEQFIRNILDTVDEGFLVIDRDYRIVTANRAYCLQAGRPCEAILGKYCFEISHGISHSCCEEGAECAVRRVFETGSPHTAIHRHPGPVGSTISVETKAFPIMDASGSVASVIETINNVTEKHLLEEERLKTQKLESIGTLAGGIAHDFNNLLQGIFGYISMAKLTFDRKEKSLAMLEQAEEALHLAVNLTTQLLTFSKGGKPSKRLIRLEPVIENAVKFALSGSHTDYRLDITPDLWPVEADEGQLGQVIQNIVLNANEAMAERGTVNISVRNADIQKAGPGLPEGGAFVRIDIHDTGTGISRQNLAKIFDPYFTTKQKGSGLGLATSYSIIKNHGGVIDVRSEPAKGSTFSIYLPAAKGAEMEAVTAGPAASCAKKGRILLMDDEEMVRSVATEMITSLGHKVETAGDGATAIELFRTARETGRPYDLLILDLTVKGGMGGEEAIRKIREIDPDVRAIVSSGYSDSPVVSNYRDYGFSAFLNKPYRFDALRECLNASMPT